MVIAPTAGEAAEIADAYGNESSFYIARDTVVLHRLLSFASYPAS